MRLAFDAALIYDYANRCDNPSVSNISDRLTSFLAKACWKSQLYQCLLILRQKLHKKQWKTAFLYIFYLLQGLLPAVALVAEGALELFVVRGPALLLLLLVMLLRLLLILGRRMDGDLRRDGHGGAHEASLSVYVLDAHLWMVLMSKLCACHTMVYPRLCALPLPQTQAKVS